MKWYYNKSMLHNLQTQKQWFIGMTIILLLSTTVYTNFISMTVTANNLVINQVASYSFVFNRQFDPVNNVFSPTVTAVSVGSLIKITFPAQFTTISTTPTSVACTNTAGTDLGCSLDTASKTITISSFRFLSSCWRVSIFTMRAIRILQMKL